jgi:uncharacterized protein YabN with tetrapyrrole methylase and pyrophosphatase domain
VVDALLALDPDDPSTDDALVEELGDLLYQIEFHAAIAEQEGRFSMADVASGIHDKLVRRHPHVFTAGDHATDDASLVQTWDTIKRAEKEAAGRPTGPFDSIPAALPALAYATAVVKKASRAGHVVAPAVDPTGEAERIGTALLALVIEARAAGVDAETALREVVSAHRREIERDISDAG